MNPASVDIKDLLEAESALALSFATNLFIGMSPPEPDSCVTIFDTPGFGPDLELGGSGEYYYPSIQIQVRDTSYLDAWQLADDIRQVLHGRGPIVLNGTTYTVIRSTDEPSLLLWDEKSRATFSMNFDMQRR